MIVHIHCLPANVLPDRDAEQLHYDTPVFISHYQIIIDSENHNDQITGLVEVNESLFCDQMKKQRLMVDNIKARLVSELGISVNVRLAEEKSVERSEGKSKRVIDKRKL